MIGIMDDVCSAALRYLARGWLPVLVHSAVDGCCSCSEGRKCGSAGKHPAYDEWHLLNPTEQDIHEWFSRPRNIGVALGPRSGIIDLETDDEAGEQWLLELFDGELPPVPTFQSRKGKHRLFQFRADLPEKGHKGIKQGVGKDRVNIADMKLGNGRHRSTNNPLATQSVFPPSLHHSGCRYTWLVTPDEAAPVELPDSVVAKINAICTPPIPKVHGKNGHASISSTKAVERARKYVAAIPPAITGQGGSDQTFAVACTIARFGLQGGEAATVMADYNARCVPPWSEYDLEHKLEDGLDEVLTAGEFGKMLHDDRPRPAKGKPAGRKHKTNGIAATRINPTGGAELICSDLRSASGRTDTANARRFVAQHGANVRWCEPWRKWLVWDGRRWEVDSRRQAETLAKQTADALWREVGAVLSDVEANTRAAMVKFAGETSDARGIGNMLAMVKSEPGIPILPDQLDTGLWLFNCANGTVDLTSGGRLPHSREHFLTKLCPHDYLLGAEGESPIWELTVDRIFGGNAALVGFFRRLCGSIVSAEVVEHMLPILWGSGSNGKSLIVETILDALGDDYACKGTQDLLLASHSDKHSTDKTLLHGRRLVVCTETDDGRRLAEATVKELTGGDTITARRMREDNWSFRPSHTLLLVTNHKPVVRGTDHGTWRRLRLLPFTQRFWDAGKGESGPPELKADPRLKEKLRPELPGIVRWLVDACREWQRDGLGQPDEVTAATADYRGSMDTLGRFVDECCIIQEGTTTKASDVIQAYGEWCEHNNERPVSGRKLSEYLTEELLVVKRRSNGIWYSGLALEQRF